MNRREEIEAERRREAEAVLARAERDSETVLSGTAKTTANRVAEHFGAADADQADPVEVWGKRLGRALALVAAGLLILHLVRTYAG
ncbi:hypothetical protein [Prosthecomicrobium sp. N25]|uniref:hypothetical protein n=1 Tax=Prosthecomicrobium sp. N25 TaxID=3129254 RepID=UPI00307765C1